MDKTGFEVLELFALCLIAVLVLLGNVLVILAFLLGPRSIRTYTNYFVVNLAVSDLGVGCISLPFWIVNRAGKNRFQLLGKEFLLFLCFNFINTYVVIRVFEENQGSLQSWRYNKQYINIYTCKYIYIYIYI